MLKRSNKIAIFYQMACFFFFSFFFFLFFFKLCDGHFMGPNLELFLVPSVYVTIVDCIMFVCFCLFVFFLHVLHL